MNIFRDLLKKNTAEGMVAKYVERTVTKTLESGEEVEEVIKEWKYEVNDKDKLVYDVKTKQALYYPNLGPIDETKFTFKEPPSSLHIFDLDLKKWSIDAKNKAILLDANKASKINELNILAQETINEKSDYNNTPVFERDTWFEQSREAKAWKLDNSTPTPILDTIALNRSVPREVLIEKAYEKAIRYQELAATISGQRQALEDRINSAKSQKALDEIELKFLI